MSPTVLRELRNARRRRRLNGVDVMEAIYRAYLTALMIAIAVGLISGLVADVPPSRSVMDLLIERGPAGVGAVGAFVTLLALRSATRGGPISLQAPDVRLVLTAPVSRSQVMRKPALALLRTAAFWGAVVGAVAGVAAYRRLPGGALTWIIAPAICGALMAATAVGAGMAATGAPKLAKPATVAGVGIFVWSLLDLYMATETSPYSMLGAMSLWALHVQPLSAVGAAMAASLSALGLFRIGHLSVELAERRSKIVQVIRFAAATRDVRAVALLRRQLSQERLRSKPWLTLPRRWPARFGSTVPQRAHKSAVVRRDLYGVLRWPLSRIIRLILLGIVAGQSMVGVWLGTTPLIVLAAVAMWLAALDCAEGLGQESDHPDRVSMLARAEGWLYVQHLKVPAVAMVAIALVAVVSASFWGGSGIATAVGLVSVIPAAFTALAGAAVSVLREPSGADQVVGMPELAGAQTVLREVLPPAIAAAGLLPVLMAHSALSKGSPPLEAAMNSGGLVMLVPIAVLGWIQAKGRVDSKGLRGGSSTEQRLRPTGFDSTHGMTNNFSDEPKPMGGASSVQQSAASLHRRSRRGHLRSSSRPDQERPR